LGLGVLIWSVATALGGFARSIGQLLVARATVGVGEAAYGTIGPALLADYFPRAQRGRAFSVFFLATPVGAALGYIVGGLVDQHFGWRRAFFVAGVPGVLLALLALRLHDAPRGVHDALPAVPDDPVARRATYRSLGANRRYRLTVLGYAAYTFALGGIAVWMPTFLERVRGLPRPVATVRFGAIVVVTGLIGTFAGGWLGDRLLRRTREAYLWVSAVATLLAAPLILVALTVPTPTVFWSAIVLAELLMFASTGPINSAIVNAVAPGIRAMGVAVSIFAIHLLGDVPSPALVGWISDRQSLATAVLILPAAALVGGAVWMWGAWVGESRNTSVS
jgi:MFS family permease